MQEKLEKQFANFSGGCVTPIKNLKVDNTCESLASDYLKDLTKDLQVRYN